MDNVGVTYCIFKHIRHPFDKGDMSYLCGMEVNKRTNQHHNEEKKKQKPTPTISRILDNGSIVELLYDPEKRTTSFALWNGDEWRREESISIGNDGRLVPYTPHNNLIRNEVVLLPSAPEEYHSTDDLIEEIHKYIHRYVDLTPRFEKIASYYVLLSWIYDGFNELPYLRLRGDYGSGKTRFLLTVGSLCYKPIFASGASTVSPIFHTLDAFRGTLIIDEGDFRWSDDKAEIVKILNNGNVKGFPVLRIEVSPTKEFNPRAFCVYGPKIVATRGYYDDRALESRFITEEMGQCRLRDDVPINLPSVYKDEARSLRNKLLLFRFRNLGKTGVIDSLVDHGIEPRLNQIFVPLLSIIDDEKLRSELRDVARDYHKEFIIDRGMDIEGQVLEVIKDLFVRSEKGVLSVKNITGAFINRYGDEYEKTISAKWIGTIIRKRLHLKTQKSRGVFVIPLSEKPKLDLLWERFGIAAENARQPEGGGPSDPEETETRQRFESHSGS